MHCFLVFVLSLFLVILCYSYFFSSHLRSLELKNVPLPHRMSRPIEIGEVLSQKNGTQKFLRQWPAWILFHSTSRKRIVPRNKKRSGFVTFQLHQAWLKLTFLIHIVTMWEWFLGSNSHRSCRCLRAISRGIWRFLVVGCFEPKKKHVSVGFVFRERAEMTQRENRMKKDTAAVLACLETCSFAICWWNCSWMSCK